MTTITATRLRGAMAAAVAGAVVFALPVASGSAPATADSVPTATLSSDAFERTVSGGWGSANSGGAWVSSAPSRVSVASGQGHVALDPGVGVVQTLPGSTTDMRSTVSVQVSSVPTTGNGMSAGLGVRSSSAGAYVATLRIGRAGAVSLNIVRQRAGAADSVLVGDTLLPTRATAGSLITAQVDVLGTSPVVIRAKGWSSAGSVPDWQVSTSDSSSSRLTSAGGASIRSYLSASSSSLQAGYDNLMVQQLTDSGAPTQPAPVPATSVGAAAPGTLSYAVPANAIFVTAAGSRSGSGTASSPYGSLAYALERAPSGSTLVLRGGTYRESATVPFYRQLTIQPYPGEAVWMDGSSPVTGWQKSGSTWSVSGWNYIFDHRVSHTQGADESSRFIDPAYPMAGYPDQVWVSGSRLRQVGSAAAVVSGTFFVDEAGRRLIIGSDPTGRTVEASTKQQALIIQGEGTTVRGIGVRRYANTFWMGGAISAQVNKISLENVTLQDNATTGLNGWGKQMKFDRVSLVGNGALGLGLNTADDFVLSRSLVQNNNTERFKEAPVSGGAKITLSRRVKIVQSAFERNTTTGLWFDVSAYDLTVTGNRFNDNLGTGMELEITSKALVANNYFVNNGKAGLYIIDTNGVSVWNNTFAGNAQYSIRLFQDERRSSDPVFDMLVKDVSFRNNVFAYGTGSCPFLVHDVQNRITGQAMRVTSQSNAYHRLSSTSPANFACWANGTTGLTSYKTLATFRSGTGNDVASTLNEGTPILTSAYQLTSAALSTTGSVAQPIPDPIASLIGVPVNTRKLGPVSAYQ